jgi:beta-glucosidase/6-phospho-beta-glucosidase/beta-galactosidase
MTRPAPSTFDSFFLGGFECSTHRRCDGARLDLIAATRHDRLAAGDYAELARHGIRTARDGLRWHLIETSPGRYDWSSVRPMLKAARATGTQIVWDLCHYGWPDDLDIFSAAFVRRFAGFARAAAQVIARDSDRVPFFCPINEMSFFAWAGGEVARFNPCAVGRGGELKRQLVRATIAAIDAVREVAPDARFITAEPLIHVVSGTLDVEQSYAAESYRLAQYEAVDLLTGRAEPGLGGAPHYLDILGVNFYPDNQWYFGGPTIPLGHHAYRPLSEMLAEAHARYRRPVLIAETGSEGVGRASWLHHVCEEVGEAAAAGVPVVGICLYPILDYPGWENGRACQVGLLTDADAQGRRHEHPRFARELHRQMASLRLCGGRAFTGATLNESR